MSGEKKICKRCKLEEMMAGYEGELEEYISSLDDSIKTEAQEYEKRIQLCTSCEQFLNGMCRMCGCFVKARAAKKHMSCPLNSPKWKSTES